MYPRLPLLLTLAVSSILSSSCAGNAKLDPAEKATPPAASVQPAAETPKTPVTERLMRLEGRFGEAGSVIGSASFKLDRSDGIYYKKFEVELLNGDMGERYPVLLDGVEVGALRVDSEGEGELEIEEDEFVKFPEDFPDPKVGSIVKVGHLFETELSKIELLVYLKGVVDTPDSTIWGETSYKVERLKGVITRRFKLKARSKDPGTVYPIAVDDVAVGDLDMGRKGKGELVYSEGEGILFPADFPEPKSGSVVKVGDVTEARLNDVLSDYVTQ